MSKPFLGKLVKDEELEELTSLLMANEQTQGVLNGYVEGKASLTKDHWLVVTDKRVIYYARSVFGSSSNSYYYNEISSVIGHNGTFLGDIELNIKGKTEKFSTLAVWEVDIMVDMIKKGVPVLE